MRTQIKTTLLLLYSFAIIVVVFSAFVFYTISKFSNESFYRLLEVKAFTAAKALIEKSEINPGEGISALRNEFFIDLPKRQEHVIVLDEKTDWRKIADSLSLSQSFVKELIDEDAAQYQKGDVFHKGIVYHSEGIDYLIIASAENYLSVHQSAFLTRTLLFAFIASLIFSLFISYYFSTYVFKPINKITDRVREISSENLHLRLSVENKNDELKELTNTFNDMLDRIETAFETQNNFISNASHELRTPLTAIIGEADVAISKVRTPEEYIETLTVILDEAEKLDAKTKALLFLAQTGFNGTAQKFDKVRVDQLLWDVKETVERIDPRNRVSIDMELLPENPSRLKVKGNEQLLHLAITNIISNACKYSNYQLVNVSIGASDKNVFIVVKDNGIGIPDHELKYIYDPFFRASNTRNYEGYGIGLPLTRNIIRMHKGEIIVSSVQDRGTTVQINLPIGNYPIG